jgi:hypothetical protein
VMAALLALAVLSCDVVPGAAPKGPTGSAGEVAREVGRQVAAIGATNAEVVDQPFEDVLAMLDLPKTHGAVAAEILDHIRKTRGAVSARASASAFSRPRRASRPRRSTSPRSSPVRGRR